nr:ribonuclease H-like domain-containing protein [Tanacetum cinerariifolium]
MIKVLPPKTAKEVVARERERKARTTLLMALPEDHLAKFHKMAYAKEMWEAIKSRFSSNDESKKMQKYLLKQQFEGFSVSTSKGLHKGYDRFQTLLSQLEIHGVGISYKDANQKFLRSLNSSWSQVALIMRTKPRLDTLSFDDLYNNLRVDVKGTTASSLSNTQNEGSASYTDEVIHSFFANQSSSPQLDCNDLDKINDDDLEKMELKWKVAMISMRIKKFHKRTSRKLQFDTRDTVGFDKTKVNASIAIKWGILLETAELKGIKTVEEEMVDTMETKLETMVEDLHIRMIQNLWLPLMERLLTGLDMLRKILRTLL